MAVLCFAVTEQVPFAILVIGIIISAFANEEFCKRNLFNTTTDYLQFTREVNQYDWAHLGSYKRLHCCAKGYTKLEWYKDGLLTSENTTFTDFELANQTLVSKGTRMQDTGNYTCKVYNKTAVIQKTIPLTVLDVDSNHQLLYASYKPDEYYYAQKGESVRMHCGAFIGPNGRQSNTVRWIFPDKKKFADTKDGRRTITEDLINGSEILSSTLTISPVTEEDYRTYLCSMRNNRVALNYNSTLIEGDPPDTKYRTSFRGPLIAVGVSACIFLITMFSYMHWKLEIKLFWKDRFGRLEENDKKKYDVFVCYDQKDADFALEVLVHTLEKYYNYRCFAYERDSVAGDLIPETYTKHVRLSRRFLMVVSPAVAVNNWCIYALYIAIEAMLNLHSRIICVILQDISWDTLTVTNGTINDRTLKQVLRVIPKIQWEAASSQASAKSSHKIRNCECSDGLELSNKNFIGSEENILDSQKILNKGSKQFWRALCVLLPPKRTIKLEIEPKAV